MGAWVRDARRPCLRCAGRRPPRQSAGARRRPRGEPMPAPRGRVGCEAPAGTPRERSTRERSTRGLMCLRRSAGACWNGAIQHVRWRPRSPRDLLWLREVWTSEVWTREGLTASMVTCDPRWRAGLLASRSDRSSTSPRLNPSPKRSPSPSVRSSRWLSSCLPGLSSDQPLVRSRSSRHAPHGRPTTPTAWTPSCGLAPRSTRNARLRRGERGSLRRLGSGSTTEDRLVGEPEDSGVGDLHHP